MKYAAKLLIRDGEEFIRLADVVNMLTMALQTDSVEQMFETLTKELARSQ